MSVLWKSDRFGYDGDRLYGHVEVDYWQEREKVVAEIDEQLAAVRAEMLAEWPRLAGERP